jgi:hypothetical protein
LNAILLLLALVCTVCGFWYQRHATRLRNQLSVLHANAHKITGHASVSMSLADYEPVLKFLEQLRSARFLPGYSRVLQDFSTGVDSGLHLEIFKADYDDRRLRIEAFGKARVPFDNAYRAYQGLQARLRRQGYTILEQRFDTRIDRSDFMLRLVKEMR